MPTPLVIRNLAQIVRRANKFDDPRCVFYQAVLESDTVEEYLGKVGDVFVVPPTYRERMGARRELRYMRDRCGWITERFEPDGAGTDTAAEGFRPDPAMDARQHVLRTVVQRQGQAVFRSELLRIYEERCAVTGCAVVPLLEAAHVTPYLGAHTNDLTNGILLRADIHSLWDLGLLAVVPSSRTVWVSPSVTDVDSTYAALQGVRIREPSPQTFRPSEASLESQWGFAREVAG